MKKSKKQKKPIPSRKKREEEKIEAVPPARRGKFQNRSTVAFSFSPMPDLPPNSDFARLAQKIEEAFLSFLKKESEKACPNVMFGGLIWQKEALPPKAKKEKRKPLKNKKTTKEKRGEGETIKENAKVKKEALSPEPEETKPDPKAEKESPNLEKSNAKAKEERTPTEESIPALSFVLSTAFCPFESRTFHPRARILATAKGTILSIQTPKAKR